MGTMREQSRQAGDTVLCGGNRLRGLVLENSVEQPLVTVVTAVFNGQPNMMACLESVLRQDYTNIEHIVLDGGSTDGTVAVLRAYEDRIALWRSEPDGGVYDAWNKGLKEARGEWICFLGADDEFLPGAVTAYMALAAAHPNAEYLSSQVRWVHPSGYVNPGHGRAWTWDRFAKRMCVAHVGSMHRRSLYDRFGLYDITYRTAADYEFLLRAREGLRAAYMPLPTAIMRAGGVSDRSTAFAEAARAKVSSGGRNWLLGAIELQADRIRFMLLPFRRNAERLMARWSS
jgi:glycosyltransferase involved in cell wall biosynthesis